MRTITACAVTLAVSLLASSPLSADWTTYLANKAKNLEASAKFSRGGSSVTASDFSSGGMAMLLFGKSDGPGELGLRLMSRGDWETGAEAIQFSLRDISNAEGEDANGRKFGSSGISGTSTGFNSMSPLLSWVQFGQNPHSGASSPAGAPVAGFTIESPSVPTPEPNSGLFLALGLGFFLAGFATFAKK